MGRMTLDPAAAPTFTTEERARIDGLTPEQIEHNAATDPDNPPLTDAELDAIALARKVRAIRLSRGMTQAAFAAAYRFPPGTLRDWEQGRRRPDRAALAYLETIRHEPEAVSRALAHAG